MTLVPVAGGTPQSLLGRAVAEGPWSQATDVYAHVEWEYLPSDVRYWVPSGGGAHSNNDTLQIKFRCGPIPSSGSDERTIFFRGTAFNVNSSQIKLSQQQSTLWFGIWPQTGSVYQYTVLQGMTEGTEYWLRIYTKNTGTRAEVSTDQGKTWVETRNQSYGAIALRTNVAPTFFGTHPGARPDQVFQGQIIDFTYQRGEGLAGAYAYAISPAAVAASGGWNFKDPRTPSVPMWEPYTALGFPTGRGFVSPAKKATHLIVPDKWGSWVYLMTPAQLGITDLSVTIDSVAKLAKLRWTPTADPSLIGALEIHRDRSNPTPTNQYITVPTNAGAYDESIAGWTGPTGNPNTASATWYIRVFAKWGPPGYPIPPYTPNGFTDGVAHYQAKSNVVTTSWPKV